MKKIKNYSLTILLLCLTALSCKKDDANGNPPGNSRVVKYEITGNFTGKLTVIYNDNVYGNTVVNNVSLPWSKEITYPVNVTGIGIGAQAITAGTAGQTAVLKIYSAGTMVKTSNSTEVTPGVVVLPTISHLF